MPQMSPRVPPAPTVQARRMTAIGALAVSFDVLRQVQCLLLLEVEHAKIPPGTPYLVGQTLLTDAWVAVVEREQRLRFGRSLQVHDREYLDIRVKQSVRELGHARSSAADPDEWVRHMLSTRSKPEAMTAMCQIEMLMQAALTACPGIFVRLQHAFEVAVDVANDNSDFHETVGEDCHRRLGKNVLLPTQDIMLIFARKLWHLRPTCEDTILQKLFQPRTHGVQIHVSDSLARDAAGKLVQSAGPQEFVDEILVLLEVAGRSWISCGDFLGCFLGRREHMVVLHLYDLSRGLAKVVAPWLLQMPWEGVWHTGVVVFGREYYFGSKIYHDKPAMTRFGVPSKRIILGHTLRRRIELHQHVIEVLQHSFGPGLYDAATNNCNHFCDRVSMFLVGKNIPDHVLKQPELMMGSSVGQAMRPLLNRWLGSKETTDGSHPNPKSSTFAAAPLCNHEMEWGQPVTL